MTTSMRVPGLGFLLSACASVATGGVPYDASGVHRAVEAKHAAEHRAEQVAYLTRLAGGRLAEPPPFCFPKSVEDDEIERTLLRNPVVDPRLAAERFFTQPTVWTGAGNQGSSGRAASASLTYSFPAQGIQWGFGSGNPNDLGSGLAHLFGGANFDLGREYFRQSLAAWRRNAGITFTEVADDNSPLDNSTFRVSTRGDMRFGGGFDWPDSFLAYNYYPSSGGDGNYNSRYWDNLFNQSSNSYRALRNTIIHEVGHGLGFEHVVPCNNLFVMEPFLSTSFDSAQTDDLRNVNRNYGDRFVGNNSAAAARDFGNLTAPAVRSVIERTLSTNGTLGVNNTDEDWFRFTIDSAQDVSIVVAPTGGSYVNGRQSSSCSGTTSTVNALNAGNLSIELRDATGTTILQTAAAFAAGSAETLTAGGLAAGTYTVRVVDVGPNPSANQIVQTYDLTVRVGTSKAPPTAIAGVNKRIMQGQECAFIGNINSFANDVGATITQYDWDLDGNGTFEVVNNPRPTTTYSTTGTRVVTLRITDSNGLADTDTISVDVFPAGFTVNSMTPFPLRNALGTTVPITIFGTSLSSITSMSQVSISGTGVTLVGAPIVNGSASQISGISLQIAPDAPKGPRVITLTSAAGTASAVCHLYPAAPSAISIVSPANGSTTSTLAPTIEWTSAGQGAGYAVELSTNSGFSNIIASTSFSYTSTRWAVPFSLLASNTEYWVRVRAGNEAGSTPSSQTISFRTPSDGPSGSNDFCAFALPVTSAGAPFNTANAGTDGPLHSDCDPESGSNIDFDVWFTYTAPCTGIADFSVCGSNFDTFIAVYQGGCPFSGGTLVGCNDQFCEDSSVVFASVTSQTTYLVRIGGWNFARGAGVLTVRCSPTNCPGDADDSGRVDFDDLTTVLANFGSTVGSFGPGDADGSGQVNFDDLTTVLANFGNTCVG